ncbi:MAG: hypothetical protein AAF411_12035 [Myxococcota bacterium]
MGRTAPRQKTAPPARELRLGTRALAAAAYWVWFGGAFAPGVGLGVVGAVYGWSPLVVQPIGVAVSILMVALAQRTWGEWLCFLGLIADAGEPRTF